MSKRGKKKHWVTFAEKRELDAQAAVRKTESLNNLVAAFAGQLDRTVVEDVLTTCKGDVEEASVRLLEMTTAFPDPIPPGIPSVDSSALAAENKRSGAPKAQPDPVMSTSQASASIASPTPETQADTIRLLYDLFAYMDEDVVCSGKRQQTCYVAYVRCSCAVVQFRRTGQYTYTLRVH